MSRGAAFLGSLALFAVLLGIYLKGSPAPADAPLLVYCAAGIRPPVEASQKAFDREMQVQYGSSQAMLAAIQASGIGDLYIPGDDAFLEPLRAKGLVHEVVRLAEVRAVLAVRKGNPKGVRALKDLAGLTLSIPMPESTASGRLVKTALEKAGSWEAVRSRAAVTKPTVVEVANDLKLGAADAGFVFDATVRQYPDLEAVDLAELVSAKAPISCAVLASCRQPAAALRFARFLSATDRGQREFERAGYAPAGTDAWEDRPVLRLHAGAMLRPAIEATIRDFETREGCTVTRVYNGCGILVAQMKTGAWPDVYFSCDTSFMAMVQDRFGGISEVSNNQLVIVVKKGNPHGIRGLKDLGKPGLKVGVGHEKQCALGALTQETLKQGRVLEDVMKNVVVQSPAGDLLVNQMRAGGLDAVVAYVSNATAAADELDAVAVDLPCAIAGQPVGIAKESPRRQLAGRLVEAFLSPVSRARFEAEGFRWKLQ